MRISIRAPHTTSPFEIHEATAMSGCTSGRHAVATARSAGGRGVCVCVQRATISEKLRAATFEILRVGI